MNEYVVEMNDIKIFKEGYSKKIFLRGFIINDKYEKDDFIEKRINFFLESHGHKYQLNVVCKVNNCIADDVDIELDEVEKFDVSYRIESNIEQYHYILNEQIRIVELATLSKEDEVRYTGSDKNFFGEEMALITDNRIIFLNRIKNSNCPYVSLVEIPLVNDKTFVSLLLSESEAEEYSKNKLSYKLEELNRLY